MGPKKRKSEQENSKVATASSLYQAAQPLRGLDLDTKKEGDEPLAQRRRLESTAPKPAEISLEEFRLALDLTFKVKNLRDSNGYFAKLVQATPLSILRSEVLSDYAAQTSAQFQILLIQYLLTWNVDFESRELLDFIDEVVFVNTCMLIEEGYKSFNETFSERAVELKFREYDFHNRDVIRDYPLLIVNRATLTVLSAMTESFKELMTLLLDDLSEFIPFWSSVIARRSRAVTDILRKLSTKEDEYGHSECFWKAYDFARSFPAFSVADSVINISPYIKDDENKMLMLCLIYKFLLRGYPIGAERYFLQRIVEEMRRGKRGHSYCYSLESRAILSMVGKIIPLSFPVNSMTDRSIQSSTDWWWKFLVFSCTGMFSGMAFEVDEDKLKRLDFLPESTSNRHFYEAKVVKPSMKILINVPLCLDRLNIPRVLVKLIMNYFCIDEFTISRDLAQEVDLLTVIVLD